MKGSSRNQVNWYAIAWRLPLIVWQTLFFVGPLLFMVAMSFFLVKNYRMEPTFDLGNWERTLTRPIFWNAYFFTLRLAITATIITSLIAFPASYYLSFRMSARWQRWALIGLIVPFFTSYLVRIFAWQIILAQQGVLNAGLSVVGLGPYRMLNSEFGTMIGYLTLCLPLVIILQTFALNSVDRRLVEAARNLGCGRLRTIFAVILPSAKTGIIIAAVFCFILAFGDFVAPYYLGGSKPPTLSIMIIDTSKSGQQWPRAAVIALMMILTLMFVAFSAIRYAYQRRR